MMKNIVHCPLSGIPVQDGECGRRHPECLTCGWNPRVHERRVQILRFMASQGRLHLWGKPAEK